VQEFARFISPAVSSGVTIEMIPVNPGNRPSGSLFFSLDPVRAGLSKKDA
jgi:hypothetical protein